MATPAVFFMDLRLRLNKKRCVSKWNLHINVSPSTVSREIRRNSGVRGRYNWETAQANAVQTKRRKPGNRSISKDVMEEAKHLLVTEQWSPEQISGVLAKNGKYTCCL